MASGLAEDLECPICLALFQEPHMLACGHNFCLACLQSAVPGGQEAGTCPECRGPFQIAELKRNRALGSLAEKVRRWKPDEEPVPGAPAGPWHFCEERDEPLKLLCKKEKMPICVICRDLPQHRGHEFLLIKEAMKFAQGKLKAYLKPLEKLLEGKTKNETAQQKEIEALKNCSEELLDYISKGFEALHQILHSKERDIKLRVEEEKEDNMKEMEDSLTSLKIEVSSRTEAIAKVEAAFKPAEHVLCLKGFKELMEQVKKDNRRERDCYDQDEETSDEDENSSGDDDEEEEGEEEETDDADSYNIEVIPVSPYFETFKDLLDFEVWKEKLERKIPGK